MPGEEISPLEALLGRGVEEPVASRYVPAALRRFLPAGGRPPVRLLVIAGAALVVAVPVALVAWGWLARPAPIEARMPQAAPSAEQDGGSATAVPATAPSEQIVVHVAGAVVAPGVFTLPAGTRVQGALSAAGGAAAGADLNRLNLAAAVLDGERVFVPMPGEAVPAPLGGSGAATGGAGAATAPLDINTADGASLETLPGVGPATAAAIVAHRDANGPFAAVEELLDVRGIGEAKLEALIELVSVG